MKLPHTWQLPTEIKARFGQKRSGQQRAMIADGHLLLVLHEAPQHDERDRTGVFFWRKPNGTWEYSGRGSGLQPLIRHVEKYSSAERELDREYQQARDAQDYFRILVRVGPLHHAAKNLYTTLQAAREAVPDDLDIIDMRDWAYDLERTLDLLQTDTQNALDFHSVQVATRLNILAALFFPVTAIASIFGMNLTSGLEGSSIVMFWSILLAGIILGFVIAWWALRGRFPQSRAMNRARSLDWKP